MFRFEALARKMLFQLRQVMVAAVIDRYGHDKRIPIVVRVPEENLTVRRYG